MTSQYCDHHDIIIYSLINKEFLIKKFPNRLTPISFCLLGHNTYSLVFTGVCQIPTSFSFKIFNNLLQDFSLSPWASNNKSVILLSNVLLQKQSNFVNNSLKLWIPWKLTLLRSEE